MDKIKAFSLAILAVFAPIKPIMLTAFVMVVVDLITGLIAARKKGEAITSAAFSRTLIKTAVYMTAIMMGFLTETYLTGDMLPASKIITSYIGMTELLSLVENLNVISGGSLMKSLVDKLGSQNAQDPK